MNFDQIHPELRDAARKVPKLPAHWYWFLKYVMRPLIRLRFATKSLDGVTFRDVALSHKKVRIYTPDQKNSDGCILWIHGGGMIMGNLEMNDLLCSAYARDLGIVVVSVGYRLGPEHPFPAGSDDCFEAWQWLLEHACEIGIDRNRIAIAGQSGGGCMAATLTNRIKDHAGTQPAAQVLFCPMLDDRTGANRDLDSIKHIAWPNKTNRAAWTWYLGHPAGADTVPKEGVPGRRTDFSGLPQTWIGVGDLDLFFVECKSYAEGLSAAGVPTILDIVPGGFHGFEVVAPETQVTKNFNARNHEFLKQALGL